MVRLAATLLGAVWRACSRPFHARTQWCDDQAPNDAQEDPELEAIRARRMAELSRGRPGGGAQGAPQTPEEAQEQEAAKE
jgi:hypothetical protein